MTAQRWWVQSAARWLARIDGVSNQLRLAMLGVTGASTAALSLQQYGYGRLTVPLLAAGGAATLAYTYAYTEGGVWNQMSRDRRDMADNWAGPTARIRNEMLTRGLVAADRGRRLSEDEVNTIQSELDAAFREYRDGYDINEVDA